jgi:hypothetical protein
LLISRRGVGKTFAVLRELIKLSQLPNYVGYTTFLYLSDKINDVAVNELINHIKLHIRIVGYSSLLPVLDYLIDAKNAYQNKYSINKILHYEYLIEQIQIVRKNS